MRRLLLHRVYEAANAVMFDWEDRPDVQTLEWLWEIRAWRDWVKDYGGPRREREQRRRR